MTATLRTMSEFVTVETTVNLNLEHSDKFEVEIYKISQRASSSPENIEFVHFPLLFCKGRQRNVPRIKTHIHCPAHQQLSKHRLWPTKQYINDPNDIPISCNTEQKLQVTRTNENTGVEELLDFSSKYFVQYRSRCRRGFLKLPNISQNAAFFSWKKMQRIGNFIRHFSPSNCLTLRLFLEITMHQTDVKWCFPSS